MKRQPAAVIGAGALIMTAVGAPWASAQPSDNQYPYQQFVNTAGNVRCVVMQVKVACERVGADGFHNAPGGRPGDAATATPDGSFTWVAGAIGQNTDPGNHEVALAKGATYGWHGWILMVAPDGTHVSNGTNGHGMLVSLDGNNVTPY